MIIYNDYSKQTIHTESFSIDHYPEKLLLSNMDIQ
jgi:hypothetical protein